MTDGTRDDRRRRLDSFPLQRAGNWIIVAGLVLAVGALVSAALNAYQDKVFGQQFGPQQLSGWTRLWYFLQSAVNQLPWTVIVVAAGFALRTWAGRVPPVPAAAKQDKRKVELPEAEPFPDATLFLPPPPPQPERANGSSNGDVVFAKPDDELWRS